MYSNGIGAQIRKTGTEGDLKNPKPLNFGNSEKMELWHVTAINGLYKWSNWGYIPYISQIFTELWVPTCNDPIGTHFLRIWWSEPMETPGLT